MQNYNNSAGTDFNWLKPDLSLVQNFFNGIRDAAPVAYIGFNNFSISLRDGQAKQYYSSGESDFSAIYTKTDFALSNFRTISSRGKSIFLSLYSGERNQPDTHEFFILLGWDAIFSHVVKLYMDIDRDRQWSASVNLSHTIEFNKNVSLKSEVSANYLPGMYSQYFSDYGDISYFSPTGKYESYHDGIVSVSLPITITPTLSIMPIVSYAFSFSDDAKREFKGRSLAGIANPLDPGGVVAFCGIAFAFAF